MQRQAILLSFAMVVLTGCSTANAAAVDPNNDVHCAALATGFRIAAHQQGAPPDQKNAIAFVDEWYGRKLVEAAKTRSRDSVVAEAQQVADAFDADSLSLRDELLFCSERAIQDAGLNKKK